LRLADLLPAANCEGMNEAMQGLDISGLTADSRAVEPGFLFAALPGSLTDGRRFIGDALARGAVAVLAPEGTMRPEGHPALAFLTDENPRRRLALMAAAFYGAQPAHVAAVTGTSGKTSVACFTQQLMAAQGHKSVSLGTLGLVPPIIEGPAALTTPDPVALQRWLKELSNAGVTHLAMEASSHGLDQYRLDGVRVTSAAFTNLSRDHLDYHPDMASYFAAKARLFEELLEPRGTMVLNREVEQFGPLAAIAERRGCSVIDYGRGAAALRLEAAQPLPDGLALRFRHDSALHDAKVHLVGTFQASNVLAALGLTLAEGGDADAAIAAIPGLKGAPGRMEYVGRTARGGQVFVDYAHKPGALEAVLQALRPHCDKRLWVVFGCGGDRDPGKRPMMGEIAARLADRSIVTDDNPRGEDPAKVRAAILAAAPDADEIGDRSEAIAAAVAQLDHGDLLVIAGKGHEPYQIVGEETLHFDDREEARAAIAALGGKTEGGEAT